MSEPDDSAEPHDSSAQAIDVEAVRSVNQEFYDAFEAQDLARVAAVWEQSDRAQCTHPGWPILRGWDAVLESWAGLIEGPEQLQFLLTNERVTVVGDAAWITLDENILSATGSGTVAAINLFSRTDDGWKMLGHHGSGVAQS